MCAKKRNRQGDAVVNRRRRRQPRGGSPKAQLCSRATFPRRFRISHHRTFDVPSRLPVPKTLSTSQKKSSQRPFPQDTVVFNSHMSKKISPFSPPYLRDCLLQRPPTQAKRSHTRGGSPKAQRCSRSRISKRTYQPRCTSPESACRAFVLEANTTRIAEKPALGRRCLCFRCRLADGNMKRCPQLQT